MCKLVVYITRPWQFKTWEGSRSIVLVGALTHCVLLHSMCDLKAAQINVQRCLIWELMPYEFELVHNTVEATKNICCAKGEGAVDHRTVTS